MLSQTIGKDLISPMFKALGTEPDTQKTLKKGDENVLPVLKPQPASYTAFWVHFRGASQKSVLVQPGKPATSKISVTCPISSPRRAHLPELSCQGNDRVSGYDNQWCPRRKPWTQGCVLQGVAGLIKPCAPGAPPPSCVFGDYYFPAREKPR